MVGWSKKKKGHQALAKKRKDDVDPKSGMRILVCLSVILLYRYASTLAILCP